MDNQRNTDGDNASDNSQSSSFASIKCWTNDAAEERTADESTLLSQLRQLDDRKVADSFVSFLGSISSSNSKETLGEQTQLQLRVCVTCM